MVVRIGLLAGFLLGSAIAVEAQVSCGQILQGGTLTEPRTHTLTRSLMCASERGVIMRQSHTILDCRGYSIRRTGAQLGIGILMGGGLRRSTRQWVLNCGTSGWDVGLQNTNSDVTLIERQSGTTSFAGNGVGIYVANTTFTTLLGVAAPGNDDKGIYFKNTYRPGIVNSSANSNGDSGIFLVNATEPLLINSEARRNNDPDLVLTGTVSALATHHGFIRGGIYDSIFFANGAHDNHWCGTTHGAIYGAGPTNFPWCP